MAVAEKPSFFGSVLSGIGGYAKGMLAGALVGALAGAAIGGILAATAIISGGIPAALMGGAIYGAWTLGAVGAVAGMTTDVVNYRDTGRASAQDVVNLANIAFAQGVTTGHEMTVAHAKEAEVESRKFRTLVEQNREARSQVTSPAK